jgi:hypothetical protein
LHSELADNGAVSMFPAVAWRAIERIHCLGGCAQKDIQISKRACPAREFVRGATNDDARSQHVG